MQMKMANYEMWKKILIQFFLSISDFWLGKNKTSDNFSEMIVLWVSVSSIFSNFKIAKNA